MIDIIAQKLEMSQVITDTGAAEPVTWLTVTPNRVTQIKTVAKDGYHAIQIGSGAKKRYTKPERGHLGKLDARVLHETAVTPEADYKVGDTIDLSTLSVGDKVAVSARSKGKGFAGTIKRHNFRSGPGGHGHDHHRQPGSIGAMGMPRVEKGKRMAGHMGDRKVTTKNLKVMAIDAQLGRVAINGSVPGPRGGWVIISKHE